MHDHLKRKLLLSGWMILLLTAAGCFQPLGGELEPTNAAEALPTFTPSQVPPTATPDLLVVTATLDPFAFPTSTLLVFDLGTQVVQLEAPPADLDPFWQTATAAYLQGQGIQPLDVVPLDAPTLDPLLQQATALVGTATAQAALPITQTYETMFGVSTATSPVIFQPTQAGLVVSGADCIYEVQPTDSNLYRISLLFGIPYMDIARATNMVNPNLIYVGDRLVIPGCGVTGYQPPPTTAPTQVGATQIPGGTGSGQTYLVVAGDTLYELSILWGTTVSAIATLNQIPNPNLIYIGQTLYKP
ncbi:MAG: LysM peptidoglycan-binding domain-containing protein [Chloroflexota bacterium]